jgi:hypothetical protein
MNKYLDRATKRKIKQLADPIKADRDDVVVVVVLLLRHRQNAKVTLCHSYKGFNHLQIQ